MIRVSTLVALSCVTLLLTFNSNAAPQTALLKIDNMDCPSCPFMIKKALEEIEGVTSATVSMDSKIATIEFESEEVGVDDFVSTTTELGFPANEIRE